MARPLKKRYVCCVPKQNIFTPNIVKENHNVVLTVDEYECVRLIDLEGYTQEDCALQMHISRATVQGIYNTARGKIADFLVNGKKLVIDGGDYIACGNYTKKCGHGCSRGCHKHECE